MNVYLVLAEGDNGRRYWVTSSDPLATVPSAHVREVRGPATVGPDGYPSEMEAAEALADGSLDPSGVGVVLNEDGTWEFEEEY